MKDEKKTKSQLFEELEKLRRRVAELEQTENEHKQAEEESIHWSSAVQILKESIVLSDLAGKITNVNEATLKIYGMDDSADLIGKSSFDFLALEDREKAVAGMKEVMEKGHAKNREYHVITKNGSRVPVEMSISAIKTMNGEPTGFVSVTRDITERVRMETLQTISYRVADTAVRSSDLKNLFQLIHVGLSTIMDVGNFYVSFYDAEKKLISFPYYVDENYPEMDITATRSRQFGKGLTEYVITRGKGLLATEEAIRQLAEKGKIELIGTMPRVWLGVPLKIEERTIGVVAVQSYANPTSYTEQELDLLEFISGQIAIVVERKRTEEQTQSLLRYQILMNELARALGRYTSLDDIYETIYQHVCQLMDVASFIVSLYDKEEQVIRAGFVCVAEGQVLDAADLPLLPLEKPGHGTQSQVIRSGKPMYVPDLSKAMKGISIQYDIARNETVSKDSAPYNDDEDSTKSELLAPMLMEGEVIGVMAIQSYRLDAYTQGDMDLLSGIANIAAVAIQNAHLYDETQRSAEVLRLQFVNLAETVSRIFSLRNPYVATHQQGTAKLARAVGERMRLDEDRLQSLYIGSLLHDIGKTAIPEGILRKPGELTEAEWGLVRTHPQAGYEVLKDTNLPTLVAELALQHHERLDGSGYPDGLKGNELGLEVRILAVCNVVNAMSLRHPYRLARSKQEITEEITNGKGTKYDPEVVDVLVEMIESGELELAG